MNMVFWLSLLVSLLLLCSTAKCQEPLQLLSADQLPPAAAVHVELQHLKNLSDSLLAAENWLRNHVLAHYPATNITAIVVGSTVLCSKHQQPSFGLILPSIKNIHHSLTRWGLHREIKVSAAFSSDCLDPLSGSYRVDVAEAYIKPLLAFLQGVPSPYVVKPPQGFLPSSEEILVLQKSHRKSMKNLGVSETSEMNVIVSNARRKLSYIDTSNTRVTPNPAFAAGSPLPPLVGSLPPQPTSHAPPPEGNLAPTATANPPPFGPHLPPCNPSRSAPAPVHRGHGSWCVAKPSVPAETLQEALDYACGEGNVDCEAIKQDGSCFYPDNLVAHASYAFNTYWQSTKRNGGTCGFGGTAMLITSDPSYGHCRFALT